MILKMLNKRIKGLKYEQFSLEKDTKKRQNLGTAYISTTDNDSIRHLLNLHYNVSTGTSDARVKRVAEFEYLLCNPK